MTCQRKTKTKILAMKMSNLKLTLLIANILLFPYFLSFLFFLLLLFFSLFLNSRVYSPPGPPSNCSTSHASSPPSCAPSLPLLTYQHKSLYLSLVSRKENLFLGRLRVRIDLQNHACQMSWNLVVCKCLLVQMSFVQFPL